MKYLLLLFLFFSSINAQDLNRLEKDSKSEKFNLVGEVSRDAFLLDNYKSWFEGEYNNYSVDVATADNLKEQLSRVQFLIVFGTWCGDSRREVPRFLKILDYIGVEQEDIRFIGVNREKKSGLQDIDKLEVEFVPTFFIYLGEIEAGRIIEAPETTLEEDLAEIIFSVPE